MRPADYGAPIILERRRSAVASNHNILARTDKSDAKEPATSAASASPMAAASTNPLDHYLTFGIYEGRTVVNDGLWD